MDRNLLPQNHGTIAVAQADHLMATTLAVPSRDQSIQKEPSRCKAYLRAPEYANCAGMDHRRDKDFRCRSLSAQGRLAVDPIPPILCDRQLLADVSLDGLFYGHRALLLCSIPQFLH